MTLGFPVTLAAEAEAAVVLAALPFLNKRLRCQQVHAAWDLNSVPIALSILRSIPYWSFQLLEVRNVAPAGNHLLRETAGLLPRVESTPCNEAPPGWVRMP